MTEQTRQVAVNCYTCQNYIRHNDAYVDEECDRCKWLRDNVQVRRLRMPTAPPLPPQVDDEEIPPELEYCCRDCGSTRMNGSRSVSESGSGEIDEEGYVCISVEDREPDGQDIWCRDCGGWNVNFDAAEFD